MTETILPVLTAVEIIFLRRSYGVTLSDKVHSCDIRKVMNSEPLQLRIERVKIHWFGHVFQNPL